MIFYSILYNRYASACTMYMYTITVRSPHNCTTTIMKAQRPLGKKAVYKRKNTSFLNWEPQRRATHKHMRISNRMHKKSDADAEISGMVARNYEHVSYRK